MNIVDSTMIDVFNFSDSICVVSSQINKEGYQFEPSRDNQPYSIPLSFSEIRVINSQSDIFRNGFLLFDKEIEEDVYKALGIRDWENILSNADIRNIILKPTKEGLEKIVKINNSTMFERVRGMFIQMQNSGVYDISMRVADVITKRYQELYLNKRNSDIQISAMMPKEQAQADNAEIIKNEVEKVKAELEKQIRAQIEAEYANKNKEIQSEETPEPRKAGRPTTKTK